MRVGTTGLLVVCAPLVFQLAFAGILFGLLTKLRLELRKEDQLREATVVAYQMQSHMIDSTAAVGAYVVSQDSRFKNWFEGEIEQLVHLGNTLTKLSSSDAAQLAKVTIINQNRDKIIDQYKRLMNKEVGLGIVSGGGFAALQTPVAAAGDALVQFIEIEERHAAEQVKSRANATCLLEWALVIGLSADLLVTTILWIFFTRSIARRLSTVAENVRRLAQRQALLLPLGGGDEIADVDAAVHVAKEKLSAEQARKDQILSAVREQLLQPLADLDKLLRSMAAQLADPQSKPGRKIDFACTSLQRVLRMVNELLDSQGTQRYRLRRSMISLQDLTETAQALTLTAANQRDIKVELRCRAAEFEGDFDLLTQILVNLISNAIKNSPAGEVVTVTGNVLADTCVSIEVADQGRGIPPEALNKIFEPFQQVELADATTRGGAGLGLAICKDIAQAHGGELHVESQVGIGSRFWLRVPLSSGTENIAGLTKRTVGVWQKGLLIVILPITLTLVLVVYLATSLADLEQSVKSQIRARQVAIAVNQLVVVAVNTTRAAVSVSIQGDEKSKHQLQAYAKQQTEQLNLLTRLTIGRAKEERYVEKLKRGMRDIDPAVLIQTSSMDTGSKFLNVAAAPSYSLKVGKVKLAASELLALETKQEKLGRLAATHGYERIQLALPIAVLLSICLSLATARYFFRDISTRLVLLKEKAAKLTDGHDNIGVPCQGNDEIAVVEQFVHHTFEQLRAFELFREHLIGVVSHEMKTPLQTMLGVISLLQENALGPLPAEVQSRTFVAECQIKRIVNLVMALLDAEKLRSGTFVLNKQLTRLSNVCAQAVQTIDDIAAHCEITIVPEPAESTEILADQDRIARILARLLENLLKQKSISLKLSFEHCGLLASIVTQSDGQTAEIDELSIFEHFGGNSSVSSGYLGAVAEQIVQLHGGQLTINSAAGEFRISLPAKEEC